MDQITDRLMVLNQVIGLLAVIMGVYHLVYTRWLLQDPLMHQNTHLAFGLLLVFLTALSKNPKRWPYIFSFIALVLIIISCHSEFCKSEPFY